MEHEIIRLQALCRETLGAPAPTGRDRLIAETLLDCLRELHAASARIARTRRQVAALRQVRDA